MCPFKKHPDRLNCKMRCRGTVTGVVTPPHHIASPFSLALFGLSIWLTHSGFIVSISGSAAFLYNTVTMRGTSSKFLILYSVI